MMKIAIYSLLLALAITSLSCTSFVVEGGGNKAAASGTETIHSSLYGFDWSERSKVKSSKQGIYKIEASTNGLYLFVSAISLGLYVPQNIQWWLQKFALMHLFFSIYLKAKMSFERVGGNHWRHSVDSLRQKKPSSTTCSISLAHS